MKVLFYGLWVTVVVFLACEIGQRFTNSLEDTGDVINELDLYDFPHEIQRMLPIIIKNAQKPVLIKCFGSIACTRDQFKKVKLKEKLITSQINE